MAAELVHLEECDITIEDTWCCGVHFFHARLPDRKVCCYRDAHQTREAAIECAQGRIAKGIEIPVPAAWPNQEDVI